MQTKSTENEITSLASRFINGTDQHVFLTGKAGTGKTTFLKQIINATHKKAIVAAPTGIAAINAGGVTLHSLFQLPFGSFIPDRNYFPDHHPGFEFRTAANLVKGLRMHENKRNLLRELELLIIDEVSMLRADILDAIDHVLRWVRRERFASFGGVQVLFIGDLLQLPPVVKENEWKVMKSFYPSLYFFDALVLKEQQPVYLELSKIYRQSDSVFVSLLNKLRENRQDLSDVELLNKHVNPNWESLRNKGYIFLTTHNRKAEETNLRALQQIDAKEYSYHANISGEFNEYAFPAPQELRLKVGAQVMFIKNDYSGENRYFNGKIGTIASLNDDAIFVSLDGIKEPIKVDRYEWENKKYTLNKSNNEIEDSVIGTFSHYPIKLAFAITVHKSQGLTFDKAIIDVSEAFASGQTYVAFSRLRSLDGLALTRRLSVEGIAAEEHLSEYQSNKADQSDLENLYHQASSTYLQKYILKAFNLSFEQQQFYYHVLSYNKAEGRSAKQQSAKWARNMQQSILEHEAVMAKFSKQLVTLLSALKTQEDQSTLLDRIEKAIGYFEPLLQQSSDQIHQKIGDLKGVKGVKTFKTELENLDVLLLGKLRQMHKARVMLKAVIDQQELSKDMVDQSSQHLVSKTISTPKKPKEKTKKAPRIDTKKASFDLYQDGKTLEEIARHRELALTTIEGHLAHFIALGELDYEPFLNKEKCENIITVSETIKSNSLKEIKERLGDEYSYSDIRFAMAHLRSTQTEEQDSN